MAVKIQGRRGEIALRVETHGRNRPPVGVMFVPWFGESQLNNKLTLDTTCPIQGPSHCGTAGLREPAVAGWNAVPVRPSAECCPSGADAAVFSPAFPCRFRYTSLLSVPVIGPDQVVHHAQVFHQTRFLGTAYTT